MVVPSGGGVHTAFALFSRPAQSDAVAERPRHELRAGADAELDHRVTHMGPNRVMRNVQLIRDLDEHSFRVAQVYRPVHQNPVKNYR